MKVMLAGATGALGRQLVPKLAARGHEVFGMTRSESKREVVRSMGATPVVADALDPDSVANAVAESDPEVIVHQLTALASSIDMRHFDRDFELTNRLRIEGTDHLLAAGRAIGVKRFMAQSFAGWPFARSGGPVKSEEDPLDPAPPDGMRRTLEAIRHVEEAVTGAEWTMGIVLRYGRLLRARHVDCARGRAPRAHPQAPLPGGGRRWRSVVLHTRRGRRGRDGGCHGAWIPRDLQRRGR
jgi:UDP-glucose 4-epimerase